jgi:hypothetical protein
VLGELPVKAESPVIGSVMGTGARLKRKATLLLGLSDLDKETPIVQDFLLSGQGVKEEERIITNPNRKKYWD